MKSITSLSNQTIKLARALRERKERQKTGLFFCEGLRIVIEAIQQKAALETILVCPPMLVSEIGRSTLQQALESGLEVIETDEHVFRSISLKDEPQGLAAIIRQAWRPLEVVDPNSWWIALDEVADPGNLGTILRTSDAVGCEGIILLDRATDPYDPTAVRASMGALFTQKLVRVPFDQFSAWKKSQSVFLVGATGKAVLEYRQAQYPAGLVLLMGSERLGLQDHHFQLCDLNVKIPMVGRSDSLNLAVATAIISYEIFHQQRVSEGR